MREGIEARHARDASQKDGGRGSDWWQTHGQNHLVFTANGEAYDHDYELDRAYLKSGRDDLAATAAMIAFSIEDVDWSKFKGMTDVRFDLETDAGWTRVRDGGADEYRADFGPTWFSIRSRWR